MSKLFAILVAVVLFVVLERKNFPRWAESWHQARNKLRGAGDRSRLATRLKTAGFFDGLPAERAGALEGEVRATGYGALFGHEQRAFSADDEELAEGQVGEFLQTIAPGLAAIGVPALAGSSRFEEGGAHFLDLPGEAVVLMSAAEAARDEPGDRERLAWGLVGARVLRRLNAGIAAAGKSDRFYSVYGGNDAHAMLLTPAMRDAITSTPGIKESELPYERTDEWPDFGLTPPRRPGRRPG
jgi:hypothetical protein